MQPLVESDIRSSFGNASDAELAQVSLPHDFLLTEWAHLDAFAWRDPRIAARGYLVTELSGSAAGIVLRTAVVKDGRMAVQAGAGIVYDSDPASEQQECINKAKALFRAAEEAVRFASQARVGQ